MRATASAAPSSEAALSRAAPVLFVVLWSTGFVGTQWGLRWTGPFTLLLVRLLAAATALVLVVGLTGLRWPATRAQWAHAAVAGLLLNGVYLGGSAYAVSRGLSAGVVASVVSLQPVLTALLAPRLVGDPASRRQWLGLGLGMCGVLAVVAPPGGAALGGRGGALLAVVLALAATTAGALYQRRFGRDVPIAGGAAVQYVACSAALLVLAPLSEGVHADVTLGLLAVLVWLVLGLSVGGVLLLLLLLRRESVVQVSGLLYLVPPLTAVETWLLLGVSLTLLQAIGMVVASAGVALVLRGRRGPGEDGRARDRARRRAPSNV